MEVVEPRAVITLRPSRKKDRKKVVWTEDTVDNEHMNKKKSKCCCIYEKPHKFGESDSEDSDDECEHCFGHVERRKTKLATEVDGAQTSTSTTVTAPTEPTTTITLQPETDKTDPPEKPTEKPS